MKIKVDKSRYAKLKEYIVKLPEYLGILTYALQLQVILLYRNIMIL